MKQIITILIISINYNLLSQTFKNPIIAGGYPDPSICKVGNDFYIVNSSFEYFPGLPIHKSNDLVNWELIGHGLHRKEQCQTNVNLVDVQSNGGIHAPSIRYHDGKFYIITTNVYSDPSSKKSGVVNFIVTASNPAGPWSDPIVVKGAPGIDPDIFFDDNGKIWYVGNHGPENPRFNGEGEIWLQELEPKTFQLTGERFFLWRGACGGTWAEGPHIYKKDGRYYLLIAEGGTHFNHAVMIAVSDKIQGPYVSNDRNPILSTRNLSYDNWVHSTGHGDLVELDDGRWFMVSLGIRGDVERASNMGRETHIMPVVWEREPYEWKEKKYLWPVVAPKTGRVLRENIMIFKNSKSQNTTSFYDDFNKEQMNLKWNFRRVPMDNIFSLSDVPGFLRLFAFTEEIRERGRASLVGFNQTESDFEYSAKIKLNLKNNQTEVGIIIIQKDDNYISFNVKKNRDKLVLGLSVKESDKEKFVFKQENVELPENEILLKIISKNERYDFFYSNNENDSYKLFGSTTSNLVLSKGYTGAQLGLYATSNGKKYFDKGYADIDWVSYIPAPRKN